MTDIISEARTRPAAAVIEIAAEIDPGSALAGMLRERGTVLDRTEASHDAVLTPAVPGGLSHAERAAIAGRMVRYYGDARLASHYDRLRQEAGSSAALDGIAAGDVLPDGLDGRFAAMVRHADLLTRAPKRARRADIAALKKAEVEESDIVRLSGLAGFVSYQAGIVAGLRLLGGRSGEAAPAEREDKDAQPESPFTTNTLTWTPYVTPIAPRDATDEQREALKITPSNTKVSAYPLVLAHDPESLAQRSPLYNAIMYGAGGLSRAERELGAVAASVVNGCVYCASVHGGRYVVLTKRPEVIEHIFAGGTGDRHEPRDKGIFDFATKLSRHPAEPAAGDLEMLRAVGLDEREILDLVLSAALFGWANRLMHSLGEPG